MRQTTVPQPIPQEICLACDICCRFPERESFLAPVFTDQEIDKIRRACVETPEFRPIPSSKGGQVIPVSSGSTFRCPFFDPETHVCSIYEHRPLDCRLYPYALMLDPSSSEVWLGIDSKCPATDDPNIMDSLVTGARQVWETTRSQEMIAAARDVPRLVGPHQPDVFPLLRLEEFTETLVSARRLNPWTSPTTAFSHGLSPDDAVAGSVPTDPPRPLTLSDRPLVERFLGETKRLLSNYTFAMLYMTNDIIPIVWREADDFLCLWAFDNGTVYMPLPPLGPIDFRRILPECFAFMDRYNPNPDVSRIENISPLHMPRTGLERYQTRPRYPEYVYRREDMVKLQGRAFHGKRTACRAFERHTEILLRPYQSSDAPACLALFEKWQIHRMTRTRDNVARKLLDDARDYHTKTLRENVMMGLIGRVLTVKGDLAAYTFGVPLNEGTFVVALEVTDPAYRGASAFVFREFSRELRDFDFINVMDDSGIPGLRQLKRSYRPWRLEPSLVLSRR